ncbi:hypothetical protein EDB86DRAFT_2825987 [Lactarius hatsudake]|nr:hypothetical protein EDB86DRAFT_2825987 [Lactarius hatsudake]
MPAVITIGVVSRQPLLLLLLPIPLLQSLRRGRRCLGTATATIVVVIVVVAELRPLPLPSWLGLAPGCGCGCLGSTCDGGTGGDNSNDEGDEMGERVQKNLGDVTSLGCRHQRLVVVAIAVELGRPQAGIDVEPRHRRGLPSGPSSTPRHMQAHHRHPAVQKPRPPRRQAVVTRRTNAAYKSPPTPTTAAMTRTMAARTMATTLDTDTDDTNTGDTRPTTTMATNTQLTTSWLWPSASR